MTEPRTYLMWDWTQAVPVSRRIRAFDAADATRQAKLAMKRHRVARADGKLKPSRLLRGIEPYEERKHGEPPWFE